MKSEAINYLKGLINDDTTKRELDLIEFCIKAVQKFEEKTKSKIDEDYVNSLYKKFYEIYARKGSKEQGRKTFLKKMSKLKTNEQILEKARKIVIAYRQSEKEWQFEKRDKQYIPLISSWLNANVPD